jgi:hypothetical protein
VTHEYVHNLVIRSLGGSCLFAKGLGRDLRLRLRLPANNRDDQNL